MSEINPFMLMAIKEARRGILKGHGGPFGSVIVKDGKVIAKGHNRVLRNTDPTCHGEMDAIRRSCKSLGTIDLSGCELFTTGEPCPMCLCAIMWANISKVYYGCTIQDNAIIGFRDERFDEMMGGRGNLPEGFLEEMDREACLELFREYQESQHQLY